MFSEGHRWYLLHAVLETGPGGDGPGTTLHSSAEEKKKGSQKEKEMLTLELVYVELCSSHGAFHRAGFNKAT